MANPSQMLPSAGLTDRGWAHVLKVGLLLASCLGWARFVRIALPEVLEGHLARSSAREAFQRAHARNFTPAAMAMLLR